MANTAKQKHNSVVYLHRDSWLFFENKPPVDEGWYAVAGTSAEGDWVSVFELVGDSLLGEVDHSNPVPECYLRIPTPPLA